MTKFRISNESRTTTRTKHVHSFSSEIARGEKGKICGNCLADQTGSRVYESVHATIFVFICSVHIFIFSVSFLFAAFIFFVCSISFLFAAFTFLFPVFLFYFAAFLFYLQRFFFICSVSFLFAAFLLFAASPLWAIVEKTCL